MQIENHAPYLKALMAGALCLVAVLAPAADQPAESKPRVVVLCPECGIVSDVRRIEKPVAPERDLMPSYQASTGGSEARAVPLFSFGAGGPQRVQRDPVSRSVWEVSVRYDSGQLGFVTFEMEPELKIGDRGRHVEHTLEYIAPSR